MKICIISNLYKPYNRGGAEQVVENIINELKNRGEDIVLITAKPFDVETRQCLVSTEGNVKIYQFFPLNIFFYPNDYKHNAIVRLIWHFFDMFNFHSYFKVKKILKKEKPDVVYTHNLKGIGYLIPKAIKSLKIKHVHTLHDIQLASPSGLMLKNQENNWQQTGILTRLYALICRYLFDSPNVVISPSRWLMNYYTQKGFFKYSKKEIFNNPIANLGNSVSQRKPSFPNHQLTFLYVGQIEKHKGIIFLINAFKKLRLQSKSLASTPLAKLKIIGRGSIMNLVDKIINTDDNIKLLGKLSHEDTLSAINKADFVIVPSLCYENSPNVVVEALSAGKPAIVANIGGTAELVNETNGYKFEAGNIDDLLEKLELAIRHPDKFNSNIIRTNIMREIDSDNYINKLLKL